MLNNINQILKMSSLNIAVGQYFVTTPTDFLLRVTIIGKVFSYPFGYSDIIFRIAPPGVIIIKPSTFVIVRLIYS